MYQHLELIYGEKKQKSLITSYQQVCAGIYKVPYDDRLYAVINYVTIRRLNIRYRRIIIAKEPKNRTMFFEILQL